LTIHSLNDLIVHVYICVLANYEIKMIPTSIVNLNELL